MINRRPLCARGPAANQPTVASQENLAAKACRGQPMFLPRRPPEWEAAGKAVAVATTAKVFTSTQPLAGYAFINRGRGLPIIRDAAMASAVHVLVHVHVQVKVQLEAGTGMGTDTGGGTGRYTEVHVQG